MYGLFFGEGGGNFYHLTFHSVDILLCFAFSRFWLHIVTHEHKIYVLVLQMGYQKLVVMNNVAREINIFSSRENRLQATLPDNWHPTTGLYDIGTLCRPTGHIFLHRIIHDNLILYTHINCKDARDLDILVFCFGVFWVFLGFFVSFSMFFVLVFLVWGFLGFLSFLGFCFGVFLFLVFVFCSCLVLVFCDFDCCCILHSTSLSSYVQPDDGRYGQNM